jgi:hypothetical protein
MTNSEKEQKIRENLKGDIFILKSVDNVNHKPHPYCITEKHITKQYMYLGEREIIALEKESNGKIHCGMYTNGTQYTNGYKAGWNPCHLPYEDHTKGDCVAFLQLIQNTTNELAQKCLKSLVEAIGEKCVDGFCFVDTKKKFRIS